MFRNPVLAFRTGGIPEMIREKQSGWLVDRGDNNAFKSRMNTIISDKSYLSLRESSRKLAEIFDENPFSNQYCEILKSLSPNLNTMGCSRYDHSQLINIQYFRLFLKINLFNIV